MRLNLEGNIDRLLRFAVGMRACLTKEHPVFVVLRDDGDDLAIVWEGEPPAFCRSMAMRIWGEIAGHDNNEIRHYLGTPHGVVPSPSPEKGSTP